MEQWALLSVSDKDGLGDLARWLVSQGLRLLASGGTYRYLRDQGMDVVALEELTGFDEILGGRVKTLHPRIYGGLLSRTTDQDEMDRKTLEAPLIAVVVVNLYPFTRQLERGADPSALVEEIDIGGVALIRAAAKNFERVSVIVDPGQYQQFMQTELAQQTRAQRLAWARDAMRHVAYYDVVIANTMAEWTDQSGLPTPYIMGGEAQEGLRYGENPHQTAQYYTYPGGYGFAGAILHQGKQLSYNNYADADTAWALVREFSSPAAVAIKHQNPCGVAIGQTLKEAYQKAHDADPISIFGGIVACNRQVDEETAEKMVQTFLEVIIAPSYAQEALMVFRRKKNLRVLEMPQKSRHRVDVRTVDGGFLVQERDRLGAGVEQFHHVAGPSVDWTVWREDVHLAWQTVSAVKSNAIVLAHNGMTIGIGGGQTNRIDAARQALQRAGQKAEGAVLASDAFFPFGDVMDEVKSYGVALVVQPGGSVRDQESIERAQQHGIALYFTGERHFRH